MDKFVVHIFICQDKGDPMEEVRSVLAIAGVGLEGDRYATNKGAFSGSPRRVIRHVSLISLEAIEKANSVSAQPKFFAEETRRNIVTLGVDLNKLVGKEFLVGEVRMRGVELCDPCKRPSALTWKADFDSRFANNGGLRAEILSNGTINTGDSIHALS